MDRVNAHRHIEAAEVGALLSNDNSIPNVAVARELAPLKSEPEQMREVWNEAVEQHGLVLSLARLASCRNEERALRA